jgi:pyruvate dehydrogenase E1 component beta subunit
MAKMSFLQAIASAQREEMRADKRVFLMGEDSRRDMYGTTTGLLEEFGPQRILDTPISEAGMTGIAAGAAMVGMRPILDYTGAIFMYPAMDQIVSIVAKSRYLYGGQATLPLVCRGSMFYGYGYSAQHSDRPFSLFMNIPGLKIVVPSNAYDAKGLLKSAIRDDNPVLIFEDGALWTQRSEIPDEEYLIPLGQGVVRRAGRDATVVAIGATGLLASAAAEELSREGVELEIIDPRTLAPLDYDLILASVAKTGRLVVVDVSWETCSAASQIAAVVAEKGFKSLKGPVVRVATANTHVPFSPPLEQLLYPTKEKIVAAVRTALS